MLETDRRNIDVKNLKPVAPPGTSPNIMKNNVMTCISAAETVSKVLCINNAKYSVPTKLPAYVPDRTSLGFENACRKNTKKPLKKQKLKEDRTNFYSFVNSSIAKKSFFFTSQ